MPEVNDDNEIIVDK